MFSLTFVESFSCMWKCSVKQVTLKFGNVAPLLLAFSIVDVKPGIKPDTCSSVERVIFFFLLKAFWILK